MFTANAHTKAKDAPEGDSASPGFILMGPGTRSGIYKGVCSSLPSAGAGGKVSLSARTRIFRNFLTKFLFLNQCLFLQIKVLVRCKFHTYLCARGEVSGLLKYSRQPGLQLFSHHPVKPSNSGGLRAGALRCCESKPGLTSGELSVRRWCVMDQCAVAPPPDMCAPRRVCSRGSTPDTSSKACSQPASGLFSLKAQLIQGVFHLRHHRFTHYWYSACASGPCVCVCTVCASLSLSVQIVCLKELCWN